MLQSGAGDGDAARFRARHGLAADSTVVVLMPGSRRTEAPRLMPVFGRAIGLLAQQVPSLVPVIPSAHAVAGTVAHHAAGWPVVR